MGASTGDSNDGSAVRSVESEVVVKNDGYSRAWNLVILSAGGGLAFSFINGVIGALELNSERFLTSATMFFISLALLGIAGVADKGVDF